jgi:hypothetical protein
MVLLDTFVRKRVPESAMLSRRAAMEIEVVLFVGF